MKCIYVIDDSIDFLEVFSSLLRRNNFHCVSIDSQSVLFENLATLTPDLFLIDVKFGHKDGRHLCRDLKLKHGLKDTPIILMSGDDQNLSNHKDFLADDILEKPFSFASFLAKSMAVQCIS